MRYITFDMDGLPESGDGRTPAEGEMTLDGPEITVPDHGSISLEVSKGLWLSVTHSEWATAYLRSEPVTH